MRDITLWTIGALCLGASLPAQETFSPEHLRQAQKLHARAVVLDTHSDVTPKFHDRSWNFSERHLDGHMDIPRLREAGFDAQFLSIYMGKKEGDGRAIKEGLRRIDAAHETIRRHPRELGLASTAADVRRLRKEGRIACLMGIEGGHIIENDLGALRLSLIHI